MPSSTKLSSLLRTFLSKSRASLLMLSPSSSSSATEKKPLGSFSSNPGVSEYTDCGRLQQESNIFNSLGRLQQESTAEKFLRAIHDCGEIENASELIFSYAANLPNLAIEEVILKYENLHEKLKLNPSSTSSGKLITHCCNLHEVSTALNLAEKMAYSGLTLAPEVLTDIVHAIEDTMHTIKMPCKLRVVALTCRVTALIRHRNSRPDAETFRCLIHLAIGTGDFRVADKVLEDMEELNVKPTTSIYNTIIAGYVDGINGESEVFEDEMLEDEKLEHIDETSYKEMANAKAKEKVKLVLGQMKAANLEPDSQTFSYLISISDSEGDIVKYREEMKRGGLHLTKDVYISLINAYASLGQLEKAKEIITEKGIPGGSLNEIKSALISALASHGQISDALVMYDETKNNKCRLEAQDSISIMKNLQGEDGQLVRMFEILEDLYEPGLAHWSRGCIQVLIYCVRFGHISVAVELLKRFQDRAKTRMDDIVREVFSVVPEVGDPAVIENGLELLRAIQTDLVRGSVRMALEFLISACVNMEDVDNAHLIWRKISRCKPFI